jgi:hypothetical protein
MSDPEVHCNCPTLSYKRIGQVSILDNLNLAQVQLKALNNTTHNNITILFVDVGYYASVA